MSDFFEMLADAIHRSAVEFAVFVVLGRQKVVLASTEAVPKIFSFFGYFQPESRFLHERAA
jgi:hypothetical protein